MGWGDKVGGERERRWGIKWGEMEGKQQESNERGWKEKVKESRREVNGESEASKAEKTGLFLDVGDKRADLYWEDKHTEICVVQYYIYRREGGCKLCRNLINFINVVKSFSVIRTEWCWHQLLLPNSVCRAPCISAFTQKTEKLNRKSCFFLSCGVG